MLFSTIGQIYVFLWMLGAGMLIGALYVLIAAVRRLLCAGFWLTLSADLFFGLGSAVILAAALVTGSYGRVRAYELLGACAGAALFVLCAYPPLQGLLRLPLGLLRRAVNRIAKYRLIKVIFK